MTQPARPRGALRGMTFARYFETWDPVSGGAFLAALVAMSFVPLLPGLRKGSGS